MPISFASLGGGAAVTDQGGEVLVSLFVDSTATIAASELPAGDYFINFIGSGNFTVKPYDENNELGNPILVGSGSAAGNLYKITIGSFSGIFISGFTGSIVVQEIPSATSAEIVSSTFSTDFHKTDFGTGRPFLNSNKVGGFSGSSLRTVNDLTTGESVPTYTSIGSEVLETVSGTLIATEGYGGGDSTRSILRSTNGGANWTEVKSYDGIVYNRIVQQTVSDPNQAIIVNDAKNGYNQANRQYIYSFDDGLNWTERSLPTPPSSSFYGPIFYVGGLYVTVLGRTGYDASQSYIDGYYTSPDLISWTYRANQISSGQTFDWIRAEVFDGKLHLIGRNSNASRTQHWYTHDGLNWTYLDDYGNTYFEPPESALYRRISVERDSQGNDVKMWFSRQPLNDYAAIDTSFNLENRGGWYVAPFGFSSSSDRALIPHVTKSGDLLLRSENLSSRYWIFEDSKANISGLFAMRSDREYNAIFYSSQFDTYYAQGSDRKWIASTPGNYKSFTIPTAYRGDHVSPMVEGDGWVGYVTNGYFYKSTDGQNFSEVASLPNHSSSSTQLRNLAAIGNTVVYFHSANSDGYVSTNGGESWSGIRPFNNNNYSNAWYVITIDDYFVIFSSQNGSYQWSKDGVNWTDSAQSTNWSTSYGPHPYQSKSTGKHVSHVANGNYRLLSDPEGVAVQLSFPLTADASIVQVGDAWVALPGLYNNNFNFYYTSLDGTSWTQRSTLQSGRWNGVVGTDGKNYFFVIDDTNYGGPALAGHQFIQTIQIG